MNDNKKQTEIVTRVLRLNYFNQYALESGIISKREFQIMREKILSKYGTKGHTNFINSR